MSAAVDSNPPGQFYCPTCEKHFEVGGQCPTDNTRLVRLGMQLDPLLGRELDGRFQILEKLGQGGMGAVYRGVQIGLNREVAIKVVSQHLISDAEVVKRFLREAKLASKLSHPNAVAVLEFDQTEDGIFYLVMELVTGNTLDKTIEQEGRFRPERIVRIGSQVLDALEGAHALSMVHRDIKPSNIMLLSRGRDLVKVLDFGLAKSVAQDAQNTTMTNAGALLGTPAYIPPELATGQKCDGRADLYSLGVVLYQMGSGKLPFVSDNAHELIAMHATEEVPPMTGVPRALAAVIEKMLRKDPAQRWATAAEAREALEAALDATRTPPSGFYFQDGPTTGQSIVVNNLTPTPGERASVAAISETIAQHTTGEFAEPKRRRWLIPALAAAAVIAGALMVMVLKQDKKAAEPPAPVPMQMEQPSVAPTTPPPPDHAQQATVPPPIPVDAMTPAIASDPTPVTPVPPPHVESTKQTKKVGASRPPITHDKTVPKVEDSKPTPPPVVNDPPQQVTPKPGNGSALPF
ncbi:MAG: protein kinase [Kofleriaceae bacterium]